MQIPKTPTTRRTQEDNLLLLYKPHGKLRKENFLRTNMQSKEL